MNSTGKKNRNYDYKLHPMSCTAVTFMAQQINSLKPNDNSSLKPISIPFTGGHIGYERERKKRKLLKRKEDRDIM